MTIRRLLQTGRIGLSGLAIVLGLSMVVPGGAQTTAESEAVAPPAAQVPVKKPTKSISIIPIASDAPDYAAWERVAERADEIISDANTTNEDLDSLRVELVEWRSKLLVAQGTNSTRIATLRTQMQVLGAAPAEGETEAEEIAMRRKALNDQLAQLQAPVIAAEEAYSLADGLIREIDRLMRERQADEWLRIWPTPVNPANWPAGAIGLKDFATALWEDTASTVRRPTARNDLVDNLPLIGFLLILATGLLWRGRLWIDRLTVRLQEQSSERGRRIWELVASLGQFVVPSAGIFCVIAAAGYSGLLGSLGSEFARYLGALGVSVFIAYWLGARMFPQGNVANPLFDLPPERRAEGRLVSTLLGLMVGLDSMMDLLVGTVEISEAGLSVIRFPFMVITGLFLVRMGHLLTRHLSGDGNAPDMSSNSNRLVRLLSRGMIIIGYGAPILAAIGYVSAAAAMIYPATLSLGLLGLLIILQRLVTDVYGLLMRIPENEQQALVPVLLGFVLTLATMPFFALIWGARQADLTEIWARFSAGFRLGDTRVSPMDFMYLVIVFAIGYTLTRLFQGALRTTILPKTKIDQGGQNALVSGVGYTGIFIAALVAINATGIDLSGLAIVAGALSVGIGFGLQNIVSNFVAGIILLIERPVSEGDWIEVGQVQGTVRTISVRSTRIQTFDRATVIVPNSDLVSQTVTNFTRYNLIGRLIIQVSVVHGSDTRVVESVLRSIAEAQPLAIMNPPPVVLLTGFTPEGINFEIRLILRDVNFSMDVRSEVNHQIVNRLAEAGIEMARSLRAAAADTVAASTALAEEVTEQRHATGASVVPPRQATSVQIPRKKPSSAIEPEPPRRPGPEEPTL
jgi:potassium efflux system protein